MSGRDNPRFYISAYGIARKLGYAGTEEEWLASLKGEKGDAFTYTDFTEDQLAALTAGIRSSVIAALQDQINEALESFEAAAEEKAEQILATCTAKATAAANSAAAAEGYQNQAQAAAQTATQKTNGLDDTLQMVTDQADRAKSYAVGGTGTRTGEDEDNAAYYSAQSRTIYQQEQAFMDIADSLTSAIRAMQVTLSSLSDQLAQIQDRAEEAGEAVESVEALQEQLGNVAGTVALINQTLDRVNEGDRV